jgi:hypothetical protein
MIEHRRTYFNTHFTIDAYQNMLNEIEHEFPNELDFRLAETPVFIDKKLGNQMKEACEFIIDFIKDPKFNLLTEKAVPSDEMVMNENKHPHFLAFDFGICENENGEYYPALIEMQGFPTLFGFQAFYPMVLENHFNIPGGFSNYFNGYEKDSYLKFLKELIIGKVEKEHVILLELKPENQKTRIDFHCTEKYLGIKTVCLTELIQEGEKLYYNLNGNKTLIKRIYNRIIFDELNSTKDKPENLLDLTKKLDVEWVTHPNWFYKISKYTLPFLRHPAIPETFFLNEIKQLPRDLENYVLKPLFSFAGQGVIIDLKESDLTTIEDPHNWILQRKVKYADCIITPDIPAKAEIRLMYGWKDEDERPTLLTNLARLSKGKMIGTRYNKDKEWVGGSVAYFEK